MLRVFCIWRRKSVVQANLLSISKISSAPDDNWNSSIRTLSSFSLFLHRRACFRCLSTITRALVQSQRAQRFSGAFPRARACATRSLRPVWTRKAIICIYIEGNLASKYKVPVLLSAKYRGGACRSARRSRDWATLNKWRGTRQGSVSHARSLRGALLKSNHVTRDIYLSYSEIVESYESLNLGVGAEDSRASCAIGEPQKSAIKIREPRTASSSHRGATLTPRLS